MTVGKVIAKIEKGFASGMSLLSLRAIGHGTLVRTLYWVKTGHPYLPISGPCMVRAWDQEALVDAMLRRRMALNTLLPFLPDTSGT